MMKLPGPLLSVVLAASLAEAGWAAEPRTRPAAPPKPPDRVFRLTVDPAPEPRPALKVRFLIDFADQQDANAVGCYHELLVAANERSLYRKVEQAYHWRKLSLEKLPRKEVRKLAEDPDLARFIRAFELAARRTRSEWDLPIREQGFHAVVPSLGQFAVIAEVLALKARLHVADGQRREAIDAIRVGLANARHLAACPWLIGGLVALAMAGHMDRPIMDLIEMPDSENLYWALAELPRPIVSLRRAIECERALPDLYFPYLREVDVETFDEGKWDQTMRRWARISGPGGPDRRPKALKSLAEALAAAAAYPAAKQFLIQRGHAREKVEAMSVKHVLAVYMVRSLELHRDDAFKWFSLPYWQAEPHIRETEKTLRRAEKNPGAMLATMVPAIGYAYYVATRLDQRLAALQAVEAARMYAAGHDGQWPQRLEDIRQVPVPLDPVSGKPFGYRREGDRFTLSAAGPKAWPSPPVQFAIEVTLRKKPAPGGAR